MSESLPSFEKPPVVETVLGAQFDEMRGLTNAHLGLFWARLRDRSRWTLLADDWNNAIDAPVIDPSYERFPAGSAWGPLGPKLKLSQNPASRLQIRNRTNTRMVQVQNGRVHLNWTGTGKQEYVRFAKLLPEFRELFDGISQFAAEHALGAIVWNQWEITYVNHFVQGRDWQQPSDWATLFKMLPGIPPVSFLAPLETFDAAWHFEIAPEIGRLHADLRHVRVGTSSGPEAIQFSLTARGAASDPAMVLDGLSKGRAAIVLAFAEITSESAQRKWGRQ